MSEKEQEKNKIIDCYICQKSFSAKRSLKTHIATIHEGKKPFKCKICNTQFKTKSNMKGHITIIHLGKKLFQCEICNANFGHKCNLNRHVQQSMKKERNNTNETIIMLTLTKRVF